MREIKMGKEIKQELYQLQRTSLICKALKPARRLVTKLKTATTTATTKTKKKMVGKAKNKNKIEFSREKKRTAIVLYSISILAINSIADKHVNYNIIYHLLMINQQLDLFINAINGCMCKSVCVQVCISVWICFSYFFP